MSIFDRRSITEGLRRLGIDVLTAQEDGCAEVSDPDLLDRATLLEKAVAAKRMQKTEATADIVSACEELAKS